MALSKLIANLKTVGSSVCLMQWTGL
nr:hypothetical protein [Microcystis aeruginosa]